MRDGHIAGVRELPGLSDEAAIEKAKQIFVEEGASFDGFEVWERARFLYRSEQPRAGPRKSKSPA
jgi:hypothetical protein